ncbi:phosphate/phosphite/phosphonate ABC transporter substrate-binding protein [Thiohalorhabdus sp.]|uniref:phosphate/phosphite/phosphonate ABC transporter substrate-binding protein n=1 Tax=Thiohalorhabdus sp. TaxID=3094134 RepID=UPI002FC3221A
MSLPLPLSARRLLGVATLVALALAGPSAAEDEHQLRLLLPPLSSADQVYARFQPLAAHLQGSLGVSVEARVASDLDALLRLAREDRPQVTYLCPLLYTRLADDGDLLPLARIQRHGKSTFRTAVVVRRNSPYERLEELKGARFAYGNPVCAASQLVPRAMFTQAGLDPRKDFFEERTLGSNENALYTVAADLFDATAVDEASARPFVTKELLRVLRYSQPIPQYVLAASPATPEGLRRRLRAAVTGLQRPQDDAVLDAIGSGVDGFVVTEDADYDVIRRMRRQSGNGSPMDVLAPRGDTAAGKEHSGP